MKFCAERKQKSLPVIMSCMIRVLLTIAFLFVTVHRLPAPIQEIPESPTPAPEQAAKPKPKGTTKPKSEASESATNPARQQPTSKQSRFAGTWSGVMPEVPWGDVPTELIVDQSESTMEWRETGKPKTAVAAKTTLTGDTLSARFPTGMTTAVWYISPRPDGATANVRLTAFMNDQTAVFRRTIK
jgi:cytoskeletal protein RodZ